MGTGAGADGLHDWRSMRSTAGDPQRSMRDPVVSAPHSVRYAINNRCAAQLPACRPTDRRTPSKRLPPNGLTHVSRSTYSPTDRRMSSKRHASGPAHVQQETAAQRSGARPASDCRPAARALAVLLSAGRSLPSYGIKTCNYLRFKPKNVKTCMLFLAPAAFCWLTLRRAPPQVSAWTCRASDGNKAHLGRPGPAGQPARRGLKFCCISDALKTLVLQNGRQGASRRGLASVLQHKFLASVHSATQVCLERGAQSPRPGVQGPKPGVRSAKPGDQNPEPGAWGSPGDGMGLGRLHRAGGLGGGAGFALWSDVPANLTKPFGYAGES